MVNTLSGSVCAYRKETVKPRFIRIDEVMALLDVTQDEAMDIALAAGARYQLAKIILVHKERLMKFMKHSARVPSSNKIVEKKFVRIGEGSMTYSIGHHRFIEMARAAGAVYKIGEASIVDQDRASVVICNLKHEIIYMNPAAVTSCAKRGGDKLIGRSLLDCHNPESRDKIQRVVDWFAADKSHNFVYTFHNEKLNKDVYMVALRDEGKLIGYYEKHEYRNVETMKQYDLW